MISLRYYQTIATKSSVVVVYLFTMPLLHCTFLRQTTKLTNVIQQFRLCCYCCWWLFEMCIMYMLGASENFQITNCTMWNSSFEYCQSVPSDKLTTAVVLYMVCNLSNKLGQWFFTYRSEHMHKINFSVQQKFKYFCIKCISILVWFISENEHSIRFLSYDNIKLMDCFGFVAIDFISLQWIRDFIHHFNSIRCETFWSNYRNYVKCIAWIAFAHVHGKLYH